MASILKVDTLQKPDGSTPTAADLGIDVAGSVVQAKTLTTHEKITTSGSVARLVDIDITPKFSNSKFIVMACVAEGRHDNGNYDNDLALAVGYKAGAVSNSISDYSSVGGYGYTRQTISPLQPYYTNDASYGTGYDKYNVLSRPYHKEFTPVGVSAGTSMSIAVWAYSDTTAWWGAGEIPAATDSGTGMYITVLEIAQ